MNDKGPVPTTIATAKRAVMDKAFAGRQAARGSFYDLHHCRRFPHCCRPRPNSGTFSRRASRRIEQSPSKDDEVFERCSSKAIARESKPYNDSYASFITMNDGHATGLTMFLDMGAFNDVWNRRRPAHGKTGSDL